MIRCWLVSRYQRTYSSEFSFEFQKAQLCILVIINIKIV
jgi:hypothetical protein